MTALAHEESLLSPSTAARLSRLSLLARRLPEARRRGRRRTRRVGAGIDAIDKRGYAPGDDVRRIDWSAYARFERLLVRVVADEAPLRLGLLVDTSASMSYGAPTKLRQALRVAAGFAAVAVGGEDRVALVCSAPSARAVARVQGGALGLSRLLVALDALVAEGKTDLSAAARSMRGALGGRGLCVVLSDLWDPNGALDAARELRRHGHEVVLARILTEFERFSDGLDGLTLEDEESGEICELPPAGVRDAYAALFAEHERVLIEGATKLGASVLDIDPREDFDDVIARALHAGIVRAGSIA